VFTKWDTKIDEIVFQNDKNLNIHVFRHEKARFREGFRERAAGPTFRGLGGTIRKRHAETHAETPFKNTPAKKPHTLT
jgi:hypothetical protein